MPNPIEHLRDVERRPFGMADFDDLTQASAIAARTAGVLAILLAPDDQRRRHLVDFSRRGADPGWKGRGREPVFLDACAGAAVENRVDDKLGPGPSPGKVAAGCGGVRVQQHRIPDARRAFRGHRVGDDLLQAAEDHVRQHLSERVARGNG